jgi:integrase
MATIEKRNKYWRVRIRRNGYPPQSRTFDTKAQASIWARDVEAEMDRGVFVDRTEAEKNTLADIIDRYLREVTPSKRGAGPEAARLTALMRQPIALLKMAALSGAHVASYRDARLKQVSPATVNKELNHLSHVIETARREWSVQIPENPIRMVRRPPQPRARDRRLLEGEEARLLASCAESRKSFLLPVVRLAIETAMRQGEIVSLRWEHIDLDQRTAHLPETKNGEVRSVPLSSVAVKTFRSLPRSGDGDVFTGVTTEAVKRAFIRACQRAGIDDFHFHDLRHEATSRLVEKGVFESIELMRITGHKDARMLLRCTHLKASDLAKKLG